MSPSHFFWSVWGVALLFCIRQCRAFLTRRFVSKRINRKLTGSASYIVLVLIVSRIMSYRHQSRPILVHTSPIRCCLSIISGGSSSSSESEELDGFDAGSCPTSLGGTAVGCTAAIASSIPSQQFSVSQRILRLLSVDAPAQGMSSSIARALGL